MTFDGFLTRSKSMEDLFQVLDKVKDTPLAVLIHGEEGVGKERLARALHEAGSRRSKGFVAVNGRVLTDASLDCFFDGAEGGTLLLKDVDVLNARLQVKLLHFLQGQPDVRLVSTSSRDLEMLAHDGQFLEDLFFRLCEVPVTVPALRERREDIPLLAEHFLPKKYKFDKSLLKRMLEYDWPGNVRELESFLRIACSLAEGSTVKADRLPWQSPLAGKRKVKASPPTSRVSIDGTNAYRPLWTWADYEKRFITQAYRHHRYKAIATARAVGLTPPTLYRKIREWKLEEPENSLYRDPLTYQPSVTVDQFCKSVFRAALNYHQRPYAALRALGVSQGYFYKVIKTIDNL